jgi:3-oxoacyl-[acyl-carrier protein] reductase
MKLKDLVAIVTGAGTGIGRAIAERLAREGARVVVNYSASRDAAEEVVSGIQSNGGEAVALQASVAVDAQARALVQSTVDRWGRLDVLVNNAGWSKRTPHHLLEELTDEIWDRTLNTNLRGTFYCIRAAAPHLKRQPGASIVNIASVAPFTGHGSSIVYAASKAGVISMTKSLARVFAPDVRVNVVCPGFVRTRFAGWPPETFDEAAKQSPLERITTGEEVAAAVVFLATEGTAMTGETLVLDAGVSSLGRKS